MTETVTLRNGIDVDQLLATFEAIKADPSVSAFTFRASARWQDGTHNVGEIGQFIHAGQEDESRAEAFRLDGDEPPVLLGQNKGPDAVELLLQALGSATPWAMRPTPRPVGSKSSTWSTSSKATWTFARSSAWPGGGPDSPRSA
jgi:hypothetical protein